MDDFDIIQVLKSIRGLTIKCPNCSEFFDANQGRLFDIRRPYPNFVGNTFNSQLSRIDKRHKSIGSKRVTLLRKIDDIKKKEIELKKRKTERPKLVKVITKKINIGQIVEKILPSTTKFKYETKDCRSLFNPVDYISFNGLMKSGKVDSISFIEIKTGNAGLQKNQRQIKEIVNNGNLKIY